MHLLSADIVYIVSRYLPYGERLRFRECSKTCAANIYCSTDDIRHQLTNASKADAATDFLDRLLEDPRLQGDTDFYANLLEGSCKEQRFAAARHIFNTVRTPVTTRLLQIAIDSRADAETIELFLQHTTTDSKCRLLPSAARAGASEAIRTILSYCEERDDCHVNAAFSLALETGKTKSLQSLLRYPGIRRAIDFNDPRTSPLCLSIVLNKPTAFQILLRDRYLTGSTLKKALMKTLRQANSSFFLRELLSDQRVNPDQPKSLIYAMRKPSFLHLLLLDGRTTPTFATLIYAIAYDSAAAVQLLLDDGRVQPDSHDNLAVVKSAKEGKICILRVLLTRVDPSLGGSAALWEAVNHNQSEVVEILLEDGRVVLDGPRSLAGVEYPDVLSLAVAKRCESIVTLIRRHFNIL